MTATVTSLAFRRSSGRRIALVVEPKCHTCTSPLRRAIERQVLVKGLSPPSVARRFAERGGPSTHSIRRHIQRGHAPIDARSVVEEREARADSVWNQIGDAATVHATADYLGRVL